MHDGASRLRQIGAGLARLALRLSPYWWAVVPLLALVAYLPNLGERALVSEEGRRALQVTSILFGGSWWRLDVLGEPYVAKPPLLPWLMAIVSWLSGGLSEWAVRLPAVLATAAGGVVGAALARRLALAQGNAAHANLAALVAGLCLVGGGFALTAARLAETDMLASVFAGGVLAFWLGGRTEAGLDRWSLLATAACAAGVLMTKGPVPLLFPLLPMLALPLAGRRWHELRQLGAILGLAALPAGLWLALNLSEFSLGFLAAEMRFVEADRGPLVVAFSEPGNFLLAVLPGLPAALAWMWNHRRDPARREVLLALALAAFPLTVIVTLWPGGHTRYAMPAAWPIAVMAGLWAAEAWNRSRLPPVLVAVPVACLAVLAIAHAAQFGATRPAVRAARLDSDAFARAFLSVPPGPVLLNLEIVRGRRNLLAYAKRPLTRVATADLACATGVALVADTAGVEAALGTARWRRSAGPEIRGLALLLPTDAPRANCPAPEAGG